MQQVVARLVLVAHIPNGRPLVFWHIGIANHVAFATDCTDRSAKSNQVIDELRDIVFLHSPKSKDGYGRCNPQISRVFAGKAAKMLRLALILLLGLGIYYRIPTLEDRLLSAGAFLLMYLLVRDLVRDEIARQN